MNRFESLALGIAAGAAVVGYLGSLKLVLGALAVALVSYGWRVVVKPYLPG